MSGIVLWHRTGHHADQDSEYFLSSVRTACGPKLALSGIGLCYHTGHSADQDTDQGTVRIFFSCVLVYVGDMGICVMMCVGVSLLAGNMCVLEGKHFKTDTVINLDGNKLFDAGLFYSTLHRDCVKILLD